jgi:ATP-dependent 26S proteasome regulatory subunit
MDGLAEDTDVMLLLATNRADVLEPALAAGPGGVDQAVSMELSDAEPRRRLFHLHRRDLLVDESHLDSVVERDGAGHRLLPQGAAPPGGADRRGPAR